MTIAVNQTKLTAQRFLMLGEDPPGVRLELIHGEIGVSPVPNFAHSYADRMLSHILLGYIEAHDLGALVGDVDTVFGDSDVRRPDVVFIEKSKLPLPSEHGIRVRPDLCVEILSPSSVDMDRKDKFELYAEHGVPNYWIIDPLAKTFEAYRLEGRSYVQSVSASNSDTVTAAPFGELRIPLAKLWAAKKGA